jgi:hypothetical protein
VNNLNDLPQELQVGNDAWPPNSALAKHPDQLVKSPK